MMNRYLNLLLALLFFQTSAAVAAEPLLPWQPHDLVFTASVEHAWWEFPVRTMFTREGAAEPARSGRETPRAVGWVRIRTDRFFQHNPDRKAKGFNTILMQYFHGYGDYPDSPGHRNEGGKPYLDDDQEMLNPAHFQSLDTRMHVLWRGGLQTGQSRDRMFYIPTRLAENRALTPPVPVFCSESYYERAEDPERGYQSRWQVIRPTP